MENFNLKKVKLLKGGGVELVWFETTTDDNAGTYVTRHSVESPETPHEDLSKRIKGLKNQMAVCYGIRSLLKLKDIKTLTAKQKEAFKTLEKQINGIVAGVTDMIEVFQISINGEDKSRSVVISGKKLQENRSYVSMNSPRIVLSQDQFGFESELDDIILKIEEEAYKFAKERKRSAPELLDEKAA